jgi:hypothetical protein
MAKPINKTAILRGKEARIFHSSKNLPLPLFAKKGYLFFLWHREVGSGKQKKDGWCLGYANEAGSKPCNLADNKNIERRSCVNNVRIILTKH